MFRILNKIAGSIAALILYPIKSLLISVAFLLGTIVFGLALLFAFPILYAQFVADELSGFDRFTTGLRAWFSMSLVALIVAPVLTGIMLVSQVYLGIKDAFRSAFFGLADGYEHGLFFHVLHRAVFDFSLFSNILTRFTAGIRSLANHGVEGLNEEQLAGLWHEEDINYADLIDVTPTAVDHNEHIVVDVPRTKEKFIPLEKEELELAEAIDDIDDLVQTYKRLNEKLDLLAEDQLEDEFVALMPISTPVLFVKQYLFKTLDDGKQIWRVVPSTTFITDQASATHWFASSAKHPLLQDKIKDPLPFEGKETRFAIVKYQDKEDAQELMEATLLIRKKLADTRLENVQADQLMAGIRSLVGSTASFWGGSANSQSASASAETPTTELNTHPQEENNFTNRN